MARKNPSIFSTLQKTAENASAVNGEIVRQLPLDALEDNPLNRFSLAEDEQFRSTMASLKKDGFLEDIIVTPVEGCPPGAERYRIVSGHRRAAAARKLGRTTAPCKVRRYEDTLTELRALMGANLHRRNLSPFDMARQLETLREVLDREGKLPENVKAQAELMAEQTELSRATVERYLDLLNLDEDLAAWAEEGKMTMTDAYELARQKNTCLQGAVRAFVENTEPKGDFPALVHRAIAWAKTEKETPPPTKTPPSPLRSVDSFGRSIRRSTAQLRALDLSAEPDRKAIRKKLDTCLGNLEELRLTVEGLRQALEEP